jgi:ABC-type multidrug transport system ATPase subunit
MITESVVIFPVQKTSPATAPAILLARTLSNLSGIFDILVLTISLSGVNFIKRGVVKTAKNKANAPYTILLVGETGGGKTSFLRFIANVLHGNDFDHYDLDILRRLPNRQGAVGQSTTTLYEITSVSGILVSSRVFNAVRSITSF